MHDCAPVHGDILVLESILDALDEGLLVIDSANRVACINNRLRHLFGIIHDTSTGADADRFILQTLMPRISGEPGRIGFAAILSNHHPAADFSCTVRLSDGGEGRFHCSCRVVHAGILRGSRIIRLSPDMGSARAIKFRSDGHEQGMDGAKRRRIEEILSESEERYRFLVENLNEGIALVDREGIVVFANQRAAEIVDYPITGIAGAPVSMFIDEASARCLEGYLQDLGQGGRAILEIDLIRGDGSCIHTLIATTPIIDAGGTCRGFLAGVQDITLLKQMEAQLRENEEKYRSLVELSAEATLIHQDDIITYINPAGMRLLGAQDSGAIVGKNILDIIHPEFRDLVISFNARDLRGEESPLIELPIIRLDGTTIFIEGRSTRTLFAGKPAIQTIARDITHRKQAEEQLQARNRHLLLLNRIIGTSASTCLPGELLETALNQTLDLLGYDGGAIYCLDSRQGKGVLRCWRNMPDACSGLIETALETVFSDAVTVGLPCYLERVRDLDAADSHLLKEFGFATLACIPLLVESNIAGVLLVGSGRRGSFADDERAILGAVGREIGISILRGMLYQRLEAANREANLYLDILTHDIRNADNVANIYADLLIDDLEGEQRRCALKLKAGIKKSIEITANVATLRKIQEGQTGLVQQNLHDVIEAEITHFPDLCIQYSGWHVGIFADDLLPEIFTNLIGNAAKYGGPDVKVMVAVDDLDDETVIVTVADTGPGVPDDAKESIFFRFEREGGQRGSQGLGLSICRMLAARYGGRIWVEDRVPGRLTEGAAFRFTLRKAGRDRDV
ncbi:MAG: PAS domain S-box protein [Methanoculleus sp.]